MKFLKVPARRRSTYKRKSFYGEGCFQEVYAKCLRYPSLTKKHNRKM